MSNPSSSSQDVDFSDSCLHSETRCKEARKRVFSTCSEHFQTPSDGGETRFLREWRTLRFELETGAATSRRAVGVPDSDGVSGRDLPVSLRTGRAKIIGIGVGDTNKSKCGVPSMAVDRCIFQRFGILELDTVLLSSFLLMLGCRANSFGHPLSSHSLVGVHCRVGLRFPGALVCFSEF